MTTVLIVDDSAVDRRVAGGLIEKRTDWHIELARNGVDALARIEAKRPDVVLTDLQMPEMNGLELVQVMKRKYPLIPVVLMTAQGSEEIAVQALEQGAASYVPKSELSRELHDILERVLTAAGEQRSFSQLMLSLKTQQSEFVLNNDPAILLSLVSYLQSMLAQMRLFNESERLRIGVALEEALLNAAYHGNLEVSSELRETDHSEYYRLARQRMSQAPYNERSIYVQTEITQEQVRYVVRDEGPGFDPTSLPDPTDPEYLDRPCGRGLLLMRTFMDEISYNDAGNEVTLTKAVPNSAPALVGAGD